MARDPGESKQSLESPLPVAESIPPAGPTLDLVAARVIDVNNSRAREGLRVVEDYCRFGLDDAFLSRELKQLRHDLAAALSSLAPRVQLEMRDVQNDVGTQISTAREFARASLLDVVQANLKRMQEALRSLEEFAKLHDAAAAHALEQMRYRSYTLEQAILCGTTARERLADARLYALLTGSQCVAALDVTIRELAAGGVQIVQLREKELPDRTLLERARQVRRWTREAGLLFIINDRPDIARLCEADGVHVGQDELPVREARRIVGPDALIGVSTHNLEQLRQAVLDAASYVGVGPTFLSQTKAFAEFPGLEYVRQATAESSLPMFVIGGVTLDTVGPAVAAGAQRVAVSAALSGVADPRAAAAAFRKALGGDTHK